MILPIPETGTIYGAIKELYYSRAQGMDRFESSDILPIIIFWSKAGDSEYIFRIAEQVAVTSNLRTPIAQIIESSRRKHRGT